MYLFGSDRLRCEGPREPNDASCCGGKSICVMAITRKVRSVKIFPLNLSLTFQTIFAAVGIVQSTADSGNSTGVNPA